MAQPTVTDEDVRSFLDWADRERSINRQLHRGKLGYGEFALRLQMSFDRLVSETSRTGAPVLRSKG
ncbi:MAG: hypothetical protein NVS3B7_11320 [Candidatus Elarobacter sp.]